MSQRYYHTTDAAATILAEGFRDGQGSYGLATIELSGVFLSNVPVDGNEGAKGDQVLQVDLPDEVDLERARADRGRSARGHVPGVVRPTSRCSIVAPRFGCSLTTRWR